MNDIENILKEGSGDEIFTYLKTLYIENKTLTEIDIKTLKEYETSSYAMIGLIGLLINCKARILLGKKQVFNTDIQNWCNTVETTYEDLELIADKYLDDNFEEEPEYILRKVMLEYPAKSQNN